MRTEADSPYWVANIITTCGQLLLLRYEGYQDDRRADFWCDIMAADLHPLGWSRQHGKTMRAPEGETWHDVFCFVFFLSVRGVVKVVKTYIFCVTLGKFSASTLCFFFLVLQGQVALLWRGHTVFCTTYMLSKCYLMVEFN